MRGPRTPFWRRTRGLWQADPRADIEDELSFHLESRVRDLMAQGVPEPAARAQAQRTFGDVVRIREELRRMDSRHLARTRRYRLLQDLRADLRLGFRLLLRRRLFALAVIATLALGIGASTTIFSVVHGLLLRPLPWPGGDRLVVLWEHDVPRGKAGNVVSVPNFEAWRERSRSYTGLAGLMPARFTVTGDAPDRIYGGAVSPEWFSIVGVAPELGRGFTLEEARAGDVIVLSHALWERRFSANPALVGQTITLEDRPFRVLGVMPAGFDAPRFGWLEKQDFWVPFLPDAGNRNWGRFLLVLGRLREGVSLPMAQQELRGVADQLARTDPADRDWTADVVTLQAELTGDLKTPLLVLLTAVILLQLIAVVNVSSLVLARAQERDLEFSVRGVLGAGRTRLLRQLLAEAFVLISIGGPLGLLLAIWSTSALRPLLPGGLPRIEAIRADAPVLLFGGRLALITFLAIGLVPIARLLRSSLGSMLRASGGRVTRARGGSAVMVAEIALALTLTIAAGLTMRSFATLQRTPLGFTPEHLVGMRLTLGHPQYDSAASRAAYFARAIEQLESVPGVQSAAAINARPLYDGSPATAVYLAGTKLDLPPVATVRIITSNYFRTVGTQLLEGRAFTAADRAGSPLVLIVSRSLARTLVPDASITGRRIIVALNNGMNGEVVGVVDNVRFGGPAAASRPAVYIAHAQWPMEAMDVMVRSTLPLARQADALRAAIWSVDAAIPIQNLQPMSDVVAAAIAQDRVNMLILAFFSVIALILAGTGVYGVLAIDVGRRRRELGIRISMGAAPAQLRRMVLTRALATATLGVLIGSAAAAAAARAMRSMLHGISPVDARTFGGVALLMFALALLAAFVPAWRATRIDPLLAMRSD